MNKLFCEQMKEKTEFSTGAVRDSEELEEKEDYIETISWLALKRYSKYMTQQAKKYGKGNWIKGIPTDSYERSLMRHIQKYLSNKYNGTNIEPEVDHLSAIMFNLQGIIHNEEIAKTNDKK